MAERPTYKLRFLDPKKRFPAMPEQPAGRSYGVVWKVFGEDPKESCYVVEFVGKSHISLLGYVSVSGEVYKVDRPVSEASLPDEPDMQLVLDESNPSIGEITVRDSDGTMRPQARVNGSPEGTMREQSDHETWNTTRSLRYGEFMASMFLRYVIFADSENVAANTVDAGRLDEGMKNTVDKIKLVKLPEPVEVLLGFDSTPLPDAIETLLYRIDHTDNPSGIERYAAALMGEVNLPRLRTIAAKTEMSLARIDRSRLFYLNFDRSLLDQDEIDTLLAVECRLNRLSGILERIGAGLGPVASSPSFEGCSLFDLWHISKTTNDVPRLLETLSNDNPWAKPGTVACQPGGEWDVRTRFARIVEALNVVTRLDYTYRANVAEGIMLVRFGRTVVDAMPQREYDAQDDAWREVDEPKRAAWATEHDARIALALAAACFASGARITRCYVQIAAPDGEQGERIIATHSFGRAAYLANCVPVAKDLESMDMDDMPCKRMLEAYESDAPDAIEPAEVHARPRDDHRSLPPALRDLLLADTADELEVMEEDDDPYVARVIELREQAKVDRAGAFEGFSRLVEELEAKCAVAELLATGPVQTQFCDNQLVRMVLPVMEEDRSVRILRAPDALYFAQHEICSYYAEQEDFERALPEVRRLYDLARSSMQSHFALINVLARLERFDEIIEVARHGLRIASDRPSIGYLFYRLAFAYWNCDQLELALACYRLVPRGEESGSSALEEMQGLMNEMGVNEPPTFEDAVETISKAGLELPPVPAVTNQLADAAVQLVDNGFFFLARGCIFQMWRTMGNDELGSLNRSLG
ncbi:tetratricopeptide repeat protein [Collinsella aerofaciens]|uniref:tetratricopeptide repeat protein n=1 Tax=Collinsella aerofaciens TaxID=74426 RepID=UPI00359C10AB